MDAWEAGGPGMKGSGMLDFVRGLEAIMNRGRGGGRWGRFSRVCAWVCG